MTRVLFRKYLESPLLWAVAITLLLFLAGHRCFESNDDMAIIGLLSGKMGVQARPDGIYLSLPLSWLLYTLYRVSGTVPWYGIMLYSLLAGGLFFGLKTIRSAPLPAVNRAVVLAGFIVLYMYILYRLNFSAVSMYMWLMAMAYVASKNLRNVEAGYGDILIGVFLGVSYLLRPNLLFFSLAVGIPAVVTCVGPVARKRVLLLSVPVVVSVLLSSGMGWFSRSGEEYRAYERFNTVRSYFTDTASSERNERTPEALRAAGWSSEDYAVAKDWWFHDGTIFSSGRLKTFIDVNRGSRSIISPQYLLQNVGMYRTALLIIGLCLFVLLAGAPGSYPVPADRRTLVQNAARLALVLFVAGITVLAGIRFPPRVAYPVFSFFLLLAMIFVPFIPLGRVQTDNLPWKRILVLMTMPVIMYLSYAQFRELEVVHRIIQTYRNYTDESFDAVQEVTGPSTVFIYPSAASYAYSETVDPLEEYHGIEHRTTFPIGWAIGSPAYADFLRSHGFGDRQRAVSAMIDNRAAVFCYFQDDGGRFDAYYPRLVRHLQQNYAALFPNRVIMLQPVKDCRKGVKGWVFFRIVATPARVL